MQIVNHILLYSESELYCKHFSDEKVQKNVPKGKYYDVRKIEDIKYDASYINQSSGKKEIVSKIMITIPGVPNRSTFRKNKRNNMRMKNYNLASIHKRFAKRRNKKVIPVKGTTAKKWIISQVEKKVKATKLMKPEMYKECKLKTKSLLIFETYINYLDKIVGEMNGK